MWLEQLRLDPSVLSCNIDNNIPISFVIVRIHYPCKCLEEGLLHAKCPVKVRVNVSIITVTITIKYDTKIFVSILVIISIVQL